MNMLQSAAASAVLMTMISSAASAAVLNFDIGGDDPGDVDGVAQVVDGVGVTITSNTGCAYWDTSPSMGGMGAYDDENCGGNDNLTATETLKFSFDIATKILGFTLNGNHVPFGDGSIDLNGDSVDVSAGVGSPADTGYSLTWTFSDIFNENKDDRGYISSLTVSQVPLPAAGWLLLAGLGGLGVMKRRKKAA